MVSGLQPDEARDLHALLGNVEIKGHMAPRVTFLLARLETIAAPRPAAAPDAAAPDPAGAADPAQAKKTPGRR